MIQAPKQNKKRVRIAPDSVKLIPIFILLGQERAVGQVGRARSASDAAVRHHRQGVDCVRTTERFTRHRRASTPKIRNDVRGARRGSGLLSFFQTPLLFRRINDAEVVDTGIGLGGLTGAHKVGNRDGSQQADDGHDNHDFNQREAGITICFQCLHV